MEVWTNSNGRGDCRFFGIKFNKSDHTYVLGSIFARMTLEKSVFMQRPVAVGMLTLIGPTNHSPKLSAISR